MTRSAASVALSRWFLVAAAVTLCALVHASPFRVANLRCESAENPIAIDSAQPQLGWTLAGKGYDRRQQGYQILVARSPELLAQDRGDLWDSGRIASPQSTGIRYKGRPLTTRQTCYWKVCVWDEAGNPSGWSQVGSWQMGLLKDSDWQAKWIGSGPTQEPRPPAGFFRSLKEMTNLNLRVEVDSRSTLLRREFRVPKAVRSATVYVTGLGYYELTCNGQRVGDRRLAPAKTNYRQWVLYDIYDLAPALRRGGNVLGIQLGNGWFNPSTKWWDVYRMLWFGSKRAILQLHLQYTDGTSEVVGSDRTWKTHPGPVLSSCVYDGEVYDAREELTGWDRTGFDDSGWRQANEVEAPGGRLVSHLMPPIRITQRLPARALSEPQRGVYIYDLGQNFAGWAKFTMRGRPGDRVRLRYAEDLTPDGELDIQSNEKALATDFYLLKGNGPETYEPKFTFHGFRYVEVTGLSVPPNQGDLEGHVVHSDCRPTGAFSCSNELINRIHRATTWAQRSNLMGYPMDCPQRDERLGWLGDAMVTAEEAMLNFDTKTFFQHWLDGLQRNQNPTNGDISIISPRPYVPEEPDPTWSSAYLVVLWDYYLQSGDTQFLAKHYDSMCRYVNYLGTQATNHIVPQYWIGDWGTTVKGWKEGEPRSVGTAFYYYDTRILAKAARVLGRKEEADRYEKLSEGIRSSYNRAFYQGDTHQYDQGSQFSNAFPLFLGLAPESDQDKILQNILNDLDSHGGHFTVGVLGTKYLIDALTQCGRADVAYGLVNQTGFPSWAHLIEGRTTLSEFWDLRGSHNHVMLGSIDAWFYRVLAGITTQESHPGFEQVQIKPYIPADLPWVQASIQTVRGPIAVNWNQNHRKLTLEISIPPGSMAKVHVPANLSDPVSIHPNRTPLRREARETVFELGSGAYRFRSVLP